MIRMETVARPEVEGNQEGQRNVQQVGDDDKAHTAQPRDGLFRPIQHGIGDQAIIDDDGKVNFFLVRFSVAMVAFSF